MRFVLKRDLHQGSEEFLCFFSLQFSNIGHTSVWRPFQDIIEIIPPLAKQTHCIGGWGETRVLLGQLRERATDKQIHFWSQFSAVTICLRAKGIVSHRVAEVGKHVFAANSSIQHRNYMMCLNTKFLALQYLETYFPLHVPEWRIIEGEISFKK